MGLSHKHFPDAAKLPKLNTQFADVSSKKIAISKGGKTALCADFSGCIGVVMSGAGKWGALAHLHQRIQNTGLRLDLALSLVAEFVNRTLKDELKLDEEVVDVLLYYGDVGENLGQKQGMKLPAATVKTAMKCKNVIDLRRQKSDPDPWGNDFVYDPGKQIVYTAPGATGEMRTGKALEPKYNPFRWAEGEEKKYGKLVDGMANNGYCIVD